MSRAWRAVAGAAAGVVAIAIPQGGALANDTMAVFGAGGLRFERTDELQMRREDLFLSTDEVRVAYVIRNLTSHDVNGTVAFPMPDIDVGDMSETPHAFHRSANDGDIFDFHVEVDGRPVQPSFEAKAVTDAGRDVTDLLKRHGVSLVDPDHVALKGEAFSALAAAGAIYDDDEHHPNWTVKPVYHWNQVFPAGKELNVTHRYKPVLGGSVVPEASFASYRKDYCPDDGFAAAAKKLPRKSSDDVVDARWLAYVLRTGANWAGPIERFRLEIAKANSDLLTLCPIPGLKLQRQGNAFVAEAANYVPRTDIRIMFVYGCGRLSPCRQ